MISCFFCRPRLLLAPVVIKLQTNSILCSKQNTVLFPVLSLLSFVSLCPSCFLTEHRLGQYNTSALLSLFLLDVVDALSMALGA
jgi:hypothetical protein